MKNKDDGMYWIPLWVDKWIFGSTRIELQPDERAVWVDMMALASKDNGWIRANQKTPYPNEQLAGLLCITIELLERSLKRFLETGKIKIVENSAGYYLANWEEYSLTDDYKKRISKKGYRYWVHSEKDGIYSQNDVIREENIIEENSKEDTFIASLRLNPAYKEIDIDKELNKMDAWLSLPRNKGRKKTNRFILNWLNKIEKPLEVKNDKSW